MRNVAAWRWVCTILGSVVAIGGGAAELAGGSRLFFVGIVVGMVLLLVANPIWHGLRPPKPPE
jgi:hypothetical protein